MANSNTDSPFILEVIAVTLEDAVEAERGGATRLEVISRFDVGGLTPSLDLVRQITSTVQIPVRVMLRETVDFEVGDEGERQRLELLADGIAGSGAEGLVLGFLRDGRLDSELVGRVLAPAPNLKATFHRAFEEVSEPLAAIDLLKEIPQIDTVLTSGGSGAWPDKVAGLAALNERAAPEIAVLIGGGLDLHSVEFLLHSTSIRAFHLGRAARLPASASGSVCASQVREFAQLIQWKG